MLKKSSPREKVEIGKVTGVHIGGGLPYRVDKDRRGARARYPINHRETRDSIPAVSRVFFSSSHTELRHVVDHVLDREREKECSVRRCFRRLTVGRNTPSAALYTARIPAGTSCLFFLPLSLSVGVVRRLGRTC